MRNTKHCGVSCLSYVLVLCCVENDISVGTKREKEKDKKQAPMVNRVEILRSLVVSNAFACSFNS